MADAWILVRTVVLAIGWPLLAAASVLMLYHANRFRRGVAHGRAGGLVTMSMVGWIATSVLLGIAVTAFLFLDPREGGLVALPVFAVWAVTLMGMLWVSRGWVRESRALRRYYQNATRHERIKASILNRFSHAFATPLTPMAVELKMLQDGGLGPLNERQAHAVDLLVRNHGRMAHMVDEAVLAGQVHGGRISLACRAFDLGGLVRDLAATRPQVHVGHLPPLPCWGDEERLRQALTRLLDGVGETGRSEMDGVEMRDEVRLRWRIVGGRDMEGLVDPFGDIDVFSVPSSQALDLGMFTSTGIIDLHGGRLDVHTQDGTTTLRVYLPTPAEAVHRTPAWPQR